MSTAHIQPSTLTTPVSLESIKLQLIEGNGYAVVKDSVSLEEMIEYLIESVEEGAGEDGLTASKAETLLARIGKPAIPYLLKGLKHTDTTVKSVCAMALIRIGQPCVKQLNEFYVRNASRARVKWVMEFVLSELCEQFPVIEEQVELIESPVLELAHIG